MFCQLTKCLLLCASRSMLCMYELSGVCNDENCPYQHQRDFESSGDGDEEYESNTTGEPSVRGDSQSPQLVSKEQMRLLQDFAHLRSNVMQKWPVITGQGIAVEAVRLPACWESMVSFIFN